MRERYFEQCMIKPLVLLLLKTHDKEGKILTSRFILHQDASSQTHRQCCKSIDKICKTELLVFPQTRPGGWSWHRMEQKKINIKIQFWHESKIHVRSTLVSENRESKEQDKQSSHSFSSYGLRPYADFSLTDLKALPSNWVIFKYFYHLIFNLYFSPNLLFYVVI